MKTKDKKTNATAVIPKSPKEKIDYYLTEEAKDWDFSDYVRVSSGPRGMILSFGKFISEEKKFGIFSEIVIPYDVADALIKIMQEQFNKLIESGQLRKMEIEEKK